MKSQTDVKKLGTILGIWAHPDDETWACGGLMAEAIKNGQKVICITATRGEAGETADEAKWPQQFLARIRETETGRALSIIGVHDLHWLGYKDGKLGQVDPKKAVARLVKLIDEICPDTILTFEPQGVTGHADHKAICAWTCAAVKQSNCQPAVYGACETRERYDKAGRDCDQLLNVYYKTEEPFLVAEAEADLTYRLPRLRARQKMTALKAHESQISPFLSSAIGKKYLAGLCSTECFVKL